MMASNLIGISVGIGFACLIWLAHWVHGSIRLMEKCEDK